MRNAQPPLAGNVDQVDTTGSVLLLVLRAVFVLAVVAVAMGLAADKYTTDVAAYGLNPTTIVLVGLLSSIFVVALDVFIPRKSLAAISGLFFGLIAGMAIAYGLSLIIDLLVKLSASPLFQPPVEGQPAPLLSAIKLAVGVICCYLTVSFVLQTKDDIRFVIPYVEFARERKGPRSLVLDTSVIVDGRIADIAETGILESELVVPRFVLQELHTIADSQDKLKRTRGRRGLDMLNKLQASEKVDIRILDTAPERGAEGAGVDEMLVDLGLQLGGKVVTNDFNLNKVAQLRGVTVININDLANALKPVVLPGENMTVKIIKPGEEPGQGVGYLDDGTMVVTEGGRDRVGEVVQITVTSVLQTSAGRMIFGRIDGAAYADRRRPRTDRTT